MVTTRVFKAGNSQAVRIPQALAYDASVKEVEIIRQGDQLIVQPKRPASTMAELMAVLDALPRPDKPRERPPVDMPSRAWNMPDSDEDLTSMLPDASA